VVANKTVEGSRDYAKTESEPSRAPFFQEKKSFVVCDKAPLEAFNEFFDGENDVPIAL
jgi:hypothetical protein